VVIFLDRGEISINNGSGDWAELFISNNLI
jgi:hypothetical protein